MREKNKFLAPTAFCDCDNPKVVDLSKKITSGCANDKEGAIKLFLFVKNHYPYAFGRWNFKASEIISLKSGMCTTKSCLLVALLRAAGIPSGFKVMSIKGREVFGKFAIFPFLRNKISEKSIHVCVSLQLENKWIDIDPSLDDNLLRGLVAVGYEKSIMRVWDGNNDLMNFFSPEELLQKGELTESIDDYHLKKRKTARGYFLLLSNLVIKCYRFIGLVLMFRK